MKILFFLVYLNSFSQSDFNHFYDDSCYLNQTEMQELENLATQLEDRTRVNIIFLCREKEINDFSNHKNRVVIYLDEDPKKRSIESNQRGIYLKKDYLDQLAIQFLLQSQSGEEVVNSMKYLIAEIEMFKISQQQLFEKQKTEKEEGERMSPEFWFVIKMYGALLLIYCIWVAIKWNNKANNKAEFWEHYGYSRSSVWLRYSLWILVFVTYVMILNKFVFYYSELFILLIPLAFLMRPSVMLVSSLIWMLKDWRTQIPISDLNSKQISLGQKRFILDQKSETAELMLLDLLELIITKKIIVTPELMDGRYGSNRYHNFLSIDPHSTAKGISAFQDELIFQLREGKEYKVANILAKELIEEVGSFKKIRKDLFLRDLVEARYVSKKSWVFNQFQLSANELSYQKDLKIRVAEMNAALKNSIHDVFALSGIGREVLLTYNYENRIIELYNSLVENNRYSNRKETEISPLLEQSFSIYEFRIAIERQINKIQQSYMVGEEAQKGVLDD